ncbi:MAG: hypothetical protein HYV16_03015 [Gammaproteobacteria bacterium]|nr:hypothetical protein [Gammaproteobacteria bacterium]
MKTLSAVAAALFALGANSAHALDLWVDNVYITQATQTYNKSVPLVAGRRGLVRIFTRADQTNTAVPVVRLDFYYNGVYGKSVRLNADAGFSAVPTSVNSQNYVYSHDYVIAAEDVRPGLQLHVEVDPDSVYGQSNYLNDVWPSGARRADYSVDTAKLIKENVWNAPGFQTMLVPLRTYNGLVGDVNANNAEAYVNYLRRVLPVPEALDVRVHAPYYFNGNPGPSYDGTWTRVLNEMDALRYAENQPTRHYYAAIKPGYGSGGSGMAWIGGWAGMGVDWTTAMSGSNGNITWRSGTYAHETGHNLNLRHAPCGGASGTDPYYPYSWASIGVTGFDVWMNKIFNPNDGNSWTDLMSYCGYDWISDYQYKRAMTWRNNNDWPRSKSVAGTGPLAAEAAAKPGLAQAGESLLIWGRIENGAVVLEPAFRVPGPPTPEAKGSEFALEAVDVQGRLLSRHGFTVYESDHGEGRGFAFRMAMPVASKALGARTAPVSELRLVQSGQVRGALRALPAAAALKAERPAQLTKADGGKRVLQWDDRRYPVALVRDALSGEVLSFARDGRFEFEAGALREIEVQFSEGVNGKRQKFAL